MDKILENIIMEKTTKKIFQDNFLTKEHKIAFSTFDQFSKTVHLYYIVIEKPSELLGLETFMSFGHKKTERSATVHDCIKNVMCVA